jgi:predicted nucleotidyltransferase component of viral defense system
MSLTKKGAVVAEALKKISYPKSSLSYNELRTIIAIERAVARLLTNKTLESNLVFKGGFVLLKTIATTRFTKDLDAVVIGLSQSESCSLIQEALKVNLDDGIWYGKSVVEELAHSPYPGLRFSVPFQIGEPPSIKAGMNKLSQIYIDVVLDNYEEGMTITSEIMPSLLTMEKPVSWLIYPPEYIFSEKLEALISLASFSSRAKDLYDLIILYNYCQKQTRLWNAIETTFKVRNTALPSSIYQTVAAFDLRALKRAWINVGKSIGGMPFDEVWRSLLDVLEKLDKRK